MIEKSFFIIKPDGMPKKDEIIAIIRGNLNILSLDKIKISTGILGKIYPDRIESRIRELEYGIRDNPNPEVMIGIAEGQNAVRKLFFLSGEYTDPSQCAPGSIRYKFGRHEPVEFEDLKIYLNVIHRPKNKTEAMSGLRFIYIYC